MDNPSEKLENNPLVSICMLTYNRAKYIREAIDSVLAQIYTNWELIIIDDGSNDKTSAIVSSFDDNRINYIKHSENKGINIRRKESLEITNGKYVAVLDSDDIWSSVEKLEKQVTFLETNKDVGVVGTFVTLINSTGEKIGETRYGVNDVQIRDSILIRNQFTHSSVLIRGDVLDKTVGYKPMLGEDLELFLQLGKLSKFANIPESLTKYRVHEGGLSNQNLKMAKAIQKIIKLHRHEYPNFVLALAKNHIRLILGYIKLIFRF